MKSSRFYTALLSAAVAVSCAVEPMPDITEANGQEQTLTIKAVLDDSSDAAETKTVRNEDGSVSWQTGDRISLFFGSGSNGGSAFTTTDSGKTTSFTGTIEAFTAGGEDFDGGMVYFWGLYPYDADATCNNTSVTTNIPSTQRGVAGTFSTGQHMTLARSANLLMSFKSVCSGLRFSLQTEGIESAVFHPIGDEAVVGDITVSMTDGLPVVTSMRNTSSEITLIPDGGAFEVGKDYYFEFAPFTAARGFEVTLYKGNQQATFTFGTSRTFARNKYTWKTNLDEGLEWTVRPEYAYNYIDEYGADRGPGIEIVENINGVNKVVVWAPVNLGYSEDYPYGKLYQWGRKAGQGYGQANADDEAGELVYVIKSPAEEGNPFTSPLPNTFYMYNRNSRDWYSATYEEILRIDWNEITNTPYLGNPCPNGWRVPTRNELKGLIVNNTPSTTEDGIGGLFFKGSDSNLPNSSSVFFPFAGIRLSDGWSGHRGVAGFYWSSTNSHNVAFENSANEQGTEPAYGLSVRCVLDVKSPSTPTEDKTIPVVSKASLIEKSISTATVSAEVVHSGGLPILERGIVWGKTIYTTLGECMGSSKSDTADMGSFTCEATGLPAGSSMYIRAYARNEYGVAYSSPITVKTNNAPTYIDEYGVNRGLGIEIIENIGSERKAIIWAPVNLGYSKEYPYGKYYQWGRKYGHGYGDANTEDEAGNMVSVIQSTATEGIPLRDPDDNTFYTTVWSTPFDWYSATLAEQLKTDWNSISGSQYLGNPCPEGWRVPTTSELIGLVSNYTDVRKGCYCKGANRSLPDDSSVFLPAAGTRYFYDGEGCYREERGQYWSSGVMNYTAHSIYFNVPGSGQHTGISSGGVFRAHGNSVRCVLDQ